MWARLCERFSSASWRNVHPLWAMYSSETLNLRWWHPERKCQACLWTVSLSAPGSIKEEAVGSLWGLGSMCVQVCVRARCPGCHPQCLKSQRLPHTEYLLCLARLRAFYIWNQPNSPIRELIFLTPIIRWTERPRAKLFSEWSCHTLPWSAISQLISPKCPLPVWLCLIAPELLEDRYYICFISLPSSCIMGGMWWVVNEWVSEWMNTFIFKGQKSVWINCPFDFYCLIPLC